MLYDRIVDNKEVGRKIWKICTAFNNDFYSFERFALRWMICTTMNMYYIEWFVLRWVICTTLKDLNYVEWFVQRWIICTEMNYLLYSIEWFVLRWLIFITLNDFLLRCKICTTSNDLYSQGIIQRWKICTTLSDSDYDGWFVNVESFGLLLIIGYRLFNECWLCLF